MEPPLETSTYPDPPPFYKNYASWPPSGEPGPGLAPQQPPATWTSFGLPQTLSAQQRPIEEAENVPALFPDPPQPAIALKALNKAFALNYLELLDLLARDPGPQADPQWIRKVQQLHAILKNEHYLVNMYRPHQARATLAKMLEVQIEERIEAAEALKKAREGAMSELEKVHEVLAKWVEEKKRAQGVSNAMETT